MKKKKKSSKFNIVFTAVLLGVFLIFLAGVFFWESDRTERPAPTEVQMNDNTDPLNQSDSEVTEPPVTVPETQPPEPTLPEAEPRQINFLLVGRDWHSEGENGRSDTMIVCSVDTGAKTMKMVSFLRDLYVPIPGHKSNRLNASYSWGGAELLTETLEQNFGVTVDVSLEIDFEGFKTIIDYLGGVDITLTDREAKYLNKRHKDWDLVEGLNHLDGNLALDYSRIRYIDSDFYRTMRQQNVLTALLERFRTATLQEALNALDVFLDESTSNMEDEELLLLMLEMYPMLQDSTIEGHQVPADGTYRFSTVRGMSVIEADLEENREILDELIPKREPEAETDPETES